MPKMLQSITSVALLCSLSSLFSSCEGGEGPYKVQVRYTAATTLTSYHEFATGAVIGFMLTDNSGQRVKGNLSHQLKGVEERAGGTGEVVMEEKDKIEVVMSFPNVNTQQEAAALPATTFLKTEILVNGKLKKTFTLDRNTPFRAAKGVRIEEIVEVRDL